MTAMQVHTNGSVVGGHIVGVPAERRTLEAGGFRVQLVPGDDWLTLTIEGQAAPEQLLRLLAHHGVLAGDDGRVDVTITTTGGHDRYLYTADLAHRLVFTRAWNRPGRRGIFYGLNPIRGDTDGPIELIPRRTSLRNICGLLARDHPLARVDVMNLFTRRTPDAAALLTDLSDRVADPHLERQTLAAADVVIPAWGSTVTAAHAPAVRDLLALLADIGTIPSLRALDRRILTSGQPPQPAHARLHGYRQLQLVPAPTAWLDGGPLLASDAVRRGSRRPGERNRPVGTPNVPAQASAGALNPARERAETWTQRRPQPLPHELTDAGLDRQTAHQVAAQIKAWADTGLYDRAIDALRLLLRGDMPLLLDHGDREAALCEVLPQLLRATRDPQLIAQSLLIGAVCAGGVGEYAAFLECSQPGVTARHKNRDGLYPVPGISRPDQARLAYARLTGYAGTDDARGTAARGDGRTLNRRGAPTPARRYGWVDGPAGIRSGRQRG